MHDEGAEMLDSELLRDAESTSQHVALAPSSGDDLKTMRLPPPTPPPPPMHVPGALPTTNMAPLPASFPPPAPLPGIGDGTTRYQSQAPAAAARPTWLRALLDSTFPLPATTPDPQVLRVARRRAGVACIGLALTFVLVAMIVGLRGAPDDPAIAPAVAAALVVARAMFALGAGTFGYGLLRMAERLFRESRE
jgi:hypothetical protein